MHLYVFRIYCYINTHICSFYILEGLLSEILWIEHEMYLIQHLFALSGTTLCCSHTYLAALKRILRYVHMTLDFSLHLYSSSTTSLVGYTDWASCWSTWWSTLGDRVFLGDNLSSWSFKRQHTLSQSSTKAKYRGVAKVVAETAWFGNMLRGLHSPLSFATLVYYDNVSAIYLSANNV